MDDQYQHPAFPQPDDRNVHVWRYLDIEKFDWLVANGRLFMATADRLGDDSLEGTRPGGDLEWWRIEAANATSEEQRRIIEHNRDLLSRFATAFRSNYYVSCWHMNQSESEEMWRSRTKSPNAVAIQTTYRELRALLPSYVEIGMVRYIDYATERLPTLNMFEYVTHKNINNGFEREIRAVTLPPVTDELGGSHFRDHHFELEALEGFLVYAPVVDLKRLIHAVVMHPDACPEFKSRTAEICARAGLPLPVSSIFRSVYKASTSVP